MARTVIFFIYFWISLILSAPLCLLFLLFRWTGLGKITKKFLHLVVGTWAKTVLFMCGAKVTVHGKEKIPKAGKVCFIGNHQGDVDFLLMLAYLPEVAGFITKKEALLAPVINVWILVINSVFIDRKNIKKAVESINRGVKILSKGNAMIIFPEGTRSRGPVMGPFRNGSFKLATKADAIIVPFTINGTWKVWEEKKRIVPASLKLVFHDSIPTEGLSSESRKMLPVMVREKIETELKENR